MSEFKVNAHLFSLETDHKHGPETVQKVTVVSGTGDGMHFVVRTQAGIVCWAICNPLSGEFFADDVYGVISEQ